MVRLAIQAANENSSKSQAWKNFQEGGSSKQTASEALQHSCEAPSTNCSSSRDFKACSSASSPNLGFIEVATVTRSVPDDKNAEVNWSRLIWFLWILLISLLSQPGNYISRAEYIVFVFISSNYLENIMKNLKFVNIWIHFICEELNSFHLWRIEFISFVNICVTWIFFDHNSSFFYLIVGWNGLWWECQQFELFLGKMSSWNLIPWPGKFIPPNWGLLGSLRRG